MTRGPAQQAPPGQSRSDNASTAPQTGAAVEVMGDGGSAMATAQSRARRSLPLLVGGVVLAVILLINLLPGRDVDDRLLSPGNPAPNGARAVAEVLTEQGIDVVRPSSFEDALDVLMAGPATVLLYDPGAYLSADQVLELTDTAEFSVLAAPTARQLRSLDEEFDVVGPVPFDFGGDAPATEAGCSDPAATAAGRITTTGTAYSGPVECFPTPIEDETGGLVVTDTSGSVSILGAPAILSNESITDEGNAALALRSLGSQPTLVWFEPTSADVVSTGQGIDPFTLLPTWVNYLFIWLLGCSILAMLWRGRRVGPLAAEPLPVVVRAAETAEGRARLYQDSGATAHAAANLRAATLARMARRLRVDRSVAPGEIIDAASRHGGRSRAELQQRLIDYTPTTNRELVLWAQEILDLEKEITSS